MTINSQIKCGNIIVMFPVTVPGQRVALSTNKQTCPSQCSTAALLPDATMINVLSFIATWSLFRP